jgi:NodT family efflux transporter outer membrane factor (OMF) lipoprotein
MESTRLTAPRHGLNRPALPLAAATAALVACTGCAVGPDYKRPPVAVPAVFKEAGDWKPATPSDAANRGAWWEALNDPILNALEAQVASANFTLQQAAANYEQARQIARADRTTYLPTLSAAGSAQRLGQKSAPGGSGTASSYSASLQAAWEPDFWGRIRRQTESDVASAQASAADLASSRLSLQGQLAQYYIQLRIVDEKKRLLENAVEAYRRTLKISQNKYAVGVAARSDVISAEAQVDAARAQVIDEDVTRAQLEHAIAVLMGKTPSEVSIALQPALNLPVPDIPRRMPSELLERRPDIAAAERGMAAANAKIGVQTAAYFPTISLSANGGYEGSPLSTLFSAPNRFWSIGSNFTETILDFGAHHDEVLQARAAYDATVAGYRQTVLSAFQQVEDNLSGLRILADEAEVQNAAVAEATQAAQIALNEYNAGTVDYTTVVTAQVNELNDRESSLNILQSRLLSSVALIQALGGGWNSADLPGAREIYSGRAPAGTTVAAGR